MATEHNVGGSSLGGLTEAARTRAETHAERYPSAASTHIETHSLTLSAHDLQIVGVALRAHATALERCADENASEVSSENTPDENAYFSRRARHYRERAAEMHEIEADLPRTALQLTEAAREAARRTE